MNSRHLLRLAITATLLAAVAACMTAFIMQDMSQGALNAGEVTQWMALMSGWCFALAWPSTFLVGWVILRRRGRR